MSCGKLIQCPLYALCPLGLVKTLIIGKTLAMSISSIWVSLCNSLGTGDGTMLFSTENFFILPLSDLHLVQINFFKFCFLEFKKAVAMFQNRLDTKLFLTSLTYETFACLFLPTSVHEFPYVLYYQSEVNKFVGLK